MNEQLPVEIPLSKAKLCWLFILCLLFFAMGVWFLLKPALLGNSIFPPIAVQILGAITIILFGIFSLAYIRKLSDNRPGLIISPTGVTDNSSGISSGFIPWSDIVNISTAATMNQKFLMVIVKNPDEYINRQASFLTKQAMRFNLKKYGSPIAITAAGLKTTHAALEKLMVENLTCQSSVNKS